MTSILIDRLDGLSSAKAIKGPCRAASTAPLALAGLPVVDGVALAPEDRVLVKDQADARENGIYVADGGPWRRARDFAGHRDVATGTRVFVTAGDAGGGNEYFVESENPVRVGEDAIVFGLSAAAGYAAEAQAAAAAAELAEAGAVSASGSAQGAAGLADAAAETAEAAALAAAASAAEAANIAHAFVIAVSSEAINLGPGAGKVTFRMPFAFSLSAVRASLSTASSSGLVTVDINENGGSILSTALSIDANEKTSLTAASQAVIADAALADDAEIGIDVDAAGTGARGLKVTLIGVRA